MNTATDLIEQYGFRFSINTTSDVYAEMLRIQFKELGLRCRVSDVSPDRRKSRFEYKVTWWQQ